MGYKSLLIGDANVVRFWQASQTARPQLLGVPLRSVTCVDTLESALGSVTDEYDFVLVSVATSFLLEEGSCTEVRVSSTNILTDLTRRVSAAAKKSPRAQVQNQLLLAFASQPFLYTSF